MVLGLCALLLVAPAPAKARTGQGPLYLRSQNPGQAFRISSLAHDARGLPSGVTTLGVIDTITNIWGESESANYFLDFQMNDAGIFLGRGMNEHLSMGIALTERRIMNLHMDQAVLNVHKLTGIDQDGRLDVPKNDLRIAIPDYGVDLTRTELQHQLISRSAEGFIAWQWLDGGNEHLSFGTYGQLRHELGEDALIQEDSNDWTAGLAFTWPASARNIFYMNLGYTRLGEASLRELPIRHELVNGLLSWEHRFSPRSSFYTQYLVDEQIFRAPGDLARPAHQLQFGWKWRRGPLTWQFGFVENLIIFSNSPDVSVSLGLRYDFGG